jgi:hypothetical protein
MKQLQEMTYNELVELYNHYGMHIKQTATRKDLIDGIIALREIADKNLTE